MLFVTDWYMIHKIYLMKKHWIMEIKNPVTKVLILKSNTKKQSTGIDTNWTGYFVLSFLQLLNLKSKTVYHEFFANKVRFVKSYITWCIEIYIGHRHKFSIRTGICSYFGQDHIHTFKHIWKISSKIYLI